MIALRNKYDVAPLAEALGMFTLIMVYIWRLRLEHPWLWLLMLGMMIGSHVARSERPGWLGFGWRNFRAALPPVILWVFAISGVLLLAGSALGTVRQMTAKQAAANIAGYVVWGLVQQYVLNGYFLNRALEFTGNPRSRLTSLLPALLFSAAHAPNWFLMPVTLAGGFACTLVYRRYRSLYVLALAHGIVGFSLLLVVPDSISAHFLVGPRYLLDRYGVYPELLL
jgi:membrane protease YdiL (CAAX protease family)